MHISEFYCKSVLSRSSLYDIDYSINPYIGCEHACVYCYGPFYVNPRFRGMVWGDYVYVKINAPRILLNELKRNPTGSVLISSITDPYQPLEGKFMVTRRILEVLLKSSLDIYILTKSPLILRDLDILRKFKSIHVGLTLLPLSEDLRVLLEPKAPRIMERIDTLKVLNSHGIETYAFIAPFIPVICEDNIYDFLEGLVHIGLSYVVFDKLNIHGDYKPFIDRILSVLPNELKVMVKNILLFDYHGYYESLKRKLIEFSKEANLNILFSY